MDTYNLRLGTHCIQLRQIKAAWRVVLYWVLGVSRQQQERLMSSIAVRIGWKTVHEPHSVYVRMHMECVGVGIYYIVYVRRHDPRWHTDDPLRLLLR